MLREINEELREINEEQRRIDEEARLLTMEGCDCGACVARKMRQ